MKSRKEIILELTPLLDVILIMMFYILMQNTLATDKQQEEAKQQIETIEESFQAQLESVSTEGEKIRESLQSELDSEKEISAELKEELAIANAKLKGEEAFEQFVTIVNVTLTNVTDEKRKLHILSGDEDNSFTYDWDNMNYAGNALKAELDSIINGEKENPVFVVFGYNEEEIFLRDFEMIRDVLEKVSSSENIYIRYMGGEENEK